jgi:hypothetical protein
LQTEQVLVNEQIVNKAFENLLPGPLAMFRGEPIQSTLQVFFRDGFAVDHDDRCGRLCRAPGNQGRPQRRYGTVHQEHLSAALGTRFGISVAGLTHISPSVQSDRRIVAYRSPVRQGQ